MRISAARVIERARDRHADTLFDRMSEHFLRQLAESIRTPEAGIPRRAPRRPQRDERRARHERAPGWRTVRAPAARCVPRTLVAKGRSWNPTRARYAAKGPRGIWRRVAQGVDGRPHPFCRADRPLPSRRSFAWRRASRPVPRSRSRRFSQQVDRVIARKPSGAVTECRSTFRGAPLSAPLNGEKFPTPASVNDRKKRWSAGIGDEEPGP